MFCSHWWFIRCLLQQQKRLNKTGTNIGTGNCDHYCQMCASVTSACQARPRERHDRIVCMDEKAWAASLYYPVNTAWTRAVMKQCEQLVIFRGFTENNHFLLHTALSSQRRGCAHPSRSISSLGESVSNPVWTEKQTKRFFGFFLSTGNI